MTSPDDPRMRQIRRLSRGLRWLLRAAMIVLGLAATLVALGALFGVGNTMIEVKYFGDDVDLSQLSLSAYLLLAIAFAPLPVLVIGVVYQYERLLELYQRGVILQAANAFRIRRAGQLLVAFAVYDVFGAILLAVFSGLFGDRAMQFDINFVPIFLGIANIVIGHVMSIACDLHEEAELTV